MSAGESPVSTNPLYAVSGGERIRTAQSACFSAWPNTNDRIARCLPQTADWNTNVTTVRQKCSQTSRTRVWPTRMPSCRRSSGPRDRTAREPRGWRCTSSGSSTRTTEGYGGVVVVPERPTATSRPPVPTRVGGKTGSNGVSTRECFHQTRLTRLVAFHFLEGPVGSRPDSAPGMVSRVETSSIGFRTPTGRTNVGGERWSLSRGRSRTGCRSHRGRPGRGRSDGSNLPHRSTGITR